MQVFKGIGSRVAAVGLAVTMTAGLATAPAEASTEFILGFNKLTNNNVEDLEGQLFVYVTDEGSNQVSLRFANEGPIDSVIRNIYFDDGLGLLDASGGPAGMSSVGTVAFSFSDAGPGDFPPGGNNASPPFHMAATDYVAEANNPHPTWGISPGESLTLLFDLSGGTSFSNLEDAAWDNLFRVGLHVTGIGVEGDSDTYISHVVPLPAAAWAGLAMLGALGAVRGVRRRRLGQSIA